MMAYTAPTTRTTGDLITASIWNTDIVDNIAYLKANQGILVAALGYSYLGSASTFSFTGLSSSYDDLFIIIRAQPVNNVNFLMRFNNDSGNEYSGMKRSSNHTSVDSTADANATSLIWYGVQNRWNYFRVWVYDYAGTAVANKMVEQRGVQDGGTGSGSQAYTTGSGLWHPASPTAINRIDFLPSSGNLVADSYMAIFATQNV